MTITQADIWRTPARITRDHFAAIIRARGNHDLPFERDPGEYWDAIAGYGIDPLFLLSMFNHESNLGMNGTAVETHSWGNTRDPSFGADPTGHTAGRSGTFPIFRNWLDGCISTAARLVEPTWYYHDRPDIGSIFINSGPVWAPAGDLNDPAGYLRSVLDFMNANADGGTPVTTAPTAADLGYPGTVEYATGSGETMAIADVRWFVLHDTEGGFAGSKATLSGQISAHLLIDKDGSWCFMVPLTGVAYAAGNLPVNRQSINVEHVGYVDAHDGGYTDAQYRCCAAFYRWCVRQGMVNVPAVYIGKVDADGGPEPDDPGILGHMDVPRDDGRPGWGGNYGHQDPGPTYDVARMIGYIGNAPPPPPPDNKVNGHVLAGGFRALWASTPDRLRVMGLPVSEEYDGTLTTADGVLPVTIQDFERVKMVYDLSTPDPFRVRVPLRSETVKRVAKAAKK